MIDVPDSPAPPTDARRVRRLLAIFVLMLITVGVGEALRLRFKVASPIGAIKGFFFAGYAFYAVAVTSAFFVYLTTRPPRREYLRAVAAGLALDGLRELLLWKHGASIVTMRYNIGVCVGLVSLGLLAATAWKKRGSDPGRAALVALFTGLILPGFVTVSYTFLDLTKVLHPKVYDHYVYLVDGTLGFQPSFVMGRIFKAAPPLRVVADAAYIGLPAAFALTYWVDARRTRRPPVDVLVAFIVAAVAGFALYHAVPVVGPTFVFKKLYPDAAPDLARVPLQLVGGGRAPRNCMPSMHIGWALLVWWQALPHGRWVRAGGHLFLDLTIAATLGFGYHYATDIVVAFPFTLAMWAVCVESLPWSAPERLRAIGAGAAMTAAWLWVIRAGGAPFRASGAITWAAYAATIGVTVVLQRRLARRAES